MLYIQHRIGYIIRQLYLNFKKEEIDNLDRPVTSGEIELIKNFSKKKISGPDHFTGEFYHMVTEELTSILHKLFQKIKEEGNTSEVIL